MAIPRIDQALVDRGLAGSLEEARLMVLEGKVYLGAGKVSKPSDKVKQGPVSYTHLAVYKRQGPVELRGVCVSARPRPVEGSYMPVFSAGEMAAQSVAAALGVPLMRTSHQQGHLRAALVDSGLALGQPFLAMHLSGGTTEVLRCARDLGQVLLLGGTSDLHAGQLVDRVGVALGLGVLLFHRGFLLSLIHI